jgi:hypothetical protein
MSASRELSVYLNNHLAASTGGVELFRRAADSHTGAHGEELRRLAEEVAEDRTELRAIMRRLDVSENHAMVALGWLGEKAGRLKPNGYLVRRSPLSDVVELEALRVAVRGKLAGWQVLRAVVAGDERLETRELEDLVDRAEDQESRLHTLHLQAADETLVQHSSAPTR